MNITEINSSGFGAGSSRPVIKTVNKVDRYTKYMLDTFNNSIFLHADKNNRKYVKFAQKGKTLLVNSGAITSAIDLRNAGEKGFLTTIILNIRANKEAESKGLAKGFEKFI